MKVTVTKRVEMDGKVVEKTVSAEAENNDPSVIFSPECPTEEQMASAMAIELFRAIEATTTT